MVALVEAVRSWAVLQLGWLMHAYLSLCCKLDDSFDVILALLESRARKASHVHWSWIFAVQHRSILPHWRVKTGLCLSLCMLVATIIVCCSAAAVVRHAGGSCTPAYPVKLACNLFTAISLPRYSLLGASVGCAALLATAICVATTSALAMLPQHTHTTATCIKMKPKTIKTRSVSLQVQGPSLRAKLATGFINSVHVLSGSSSKPLTYCNIVQ